jgi:hypothetical protein
MQPRHTAQSAQSALSHTVMVQVLIAVETTQHTQRHMNMSVLLHLCRTRCHSMQQLSAGICACCGTQRMLLLHLLRLPDGSLHPCAAAAVMD